MGLGHPTLAEVTPTHACQMRAHRPRLSPHLLNKSGRPREVKHTQGQTLGLKEGVNLDLPALLLPSPTSVLT